jgi:hypothetical protein
VLVSHRGTLALGVRQEPGERGVAGKGPSGRRGGQEGGRGASGGLFKANGFDVGFKRE